LEIGLSRGNGFVDERQREEKREGENATERQRESRESTESEKVVTILMIVPSRALRVGRRNSVYILHRQ
jgi:hypothetical protein